MRAYLAHSLGNWVEAVVSKPRVDQDSLNVSQVHLSLLTRPKQVLVCKFEPEIFHSSDFNHFRQVGKLIFSVKVAALGRRSSLLLLFGLFFGLFLFFSLFVYPGHNHFENVTVTSRV